MLVMLTSKSGVLVVDGSVPHQKHQLVISDANQRRRRLSKETMAEYYQPAADLSTTSKRLLDAQRCSNGSRQTSIDSARLFLFFLCFADAAAAAATVLV